MKSFADTSVYRILNLDMYRSGVFELFYLQNDSPASPIKMTVFVGRFQSIKYVKIVKEGAFPNIRFSLYYDVDGCIYIKLKSVGSGNIIAINSTHDVVLSNVSESTLTEITGDITA